MRGVTLESQTTRHDPWRALALAVLVQSCLETQGRATHGRNREERTQVQQEARQWLASSDSDWLVDHLDLDKSRLLAALRKRRVGSIHKPNRRGIES